MLEHFRIVGSGADVARWAGRIETRSDRWPQHLQNGMAALAEGLIEARGALARLNGDAVTARKRDGRTETCRARLSDEMRTARYPVARVMEKIDDEGLANDDVIDLVERVARPDGGAGARLPRALDSGAVVHHLVARGAPQFNDAGRLACPIPGFRRFLTERGRQGPSQQT